MRHLPVLLEETLAWLAPQRGGLFVDCTVGLGGHAHALLERFPGTTVLGIDRDPDALALAATRLAPFGERARLARGCFSDLARLVAEQGDTPPAGIYADLGVSSMQLDVAERGFSFQNDGPLDMRMGAAAPVDLEGPVDLEKDVDRETENDDLTAAEVLRDYSEDALKKMLWTYGEEQQAPRIARAIVERRDERPLETTAELRQLIESVKTPPHRRRPTGKGRRRMAAGRPATIHPATQTFQALRIEVNRELEELRGMIDSSVELLDRDGRLVVISYHSLEDRIVKHGLRHLAVGEIDRITGRPRAESQLIEVLTKKPVRPSPAEVDANPRSRSARLRAARRL